MKTLDEVVKAHEFCLASPIYYDCKDCPYEVEGHGCGRTEMMQDALHYLREYRNCQDCAYSDSYLRCTKEDRNLPLTWSELQQMEDKPVWIEDKYCKYYGWEIVERLGTNKWMTGEFLETNGGLYRKEDQGESWQAYRKERKE